MPIFVLNETRCLNTFCFVLCKTWPTIWLGFIALPLLLEHVQLNLNSNNVCTSIFAKHRQAKGNVGSKCFFFRFSDVKHLINRPFPFLSRIRSYWLIYSQSICNIDVLQLHFCEFFATRSAVGPQHGCLLYFDRCWLLQGAGEEGGGGGGRGKERRGGVKVGGEGDGGSRCCYPRPHSWYLMSDNNTPCQK